MKRFFSLFLTLAAAIGLLSCNKNAPAVSGDAPEAVPDATLTVNIGMENEAVKATAAQVKDFQIGKVQVFVFDAAGKLETSYYEQGLDKNTTHSVKIATFTGAKTVYVIVNHNRITHFKPHTTTVANLEAEITDLSMNTPSSLVMSGKNSVNVKKYGNNGAAGTDGDLSAVSVYVKRLAAMNLQVDFRGTDLEGATFTVQQIYLKNVVGKSRLGVSGLTGAANSAVLPLAIDDATHSNIDNWYNKFTLQASGAPAVTYESDMDATCNVSGTATAMARHLFAYPNRQDTDTHSPATGTFSPRHTRFVIKAHVKAAAGYSDYDADTFYVFDLPVLQANNIYKITSIKITMLGKDSDDKDDDLQAGKIQPNITVDPWNGTTSLSYEF